MKKLILAISILLISTSLVFGQHELGHWTFDNGMEDSSGYGLDGIAHQNATTIDRLDPEERTSARRIA